VQREEGREGGKLRTDLARNSSVFLEGRKEEKGKQEVEEVEEVEEKGQRKGGGRSQARVREREQASEPL